ncbi:MAG: response regulator [Bacteroidales bacterium]|nr:response regulator [Bacteroidales bacterium]
MSSNKDVFIIDDSNTNIVLIEAILGAKGYATRTALCVKEALPQIVKHKPSLILLDLLMPEVSGFDFLAQIKNNPKLNDIPIVIISALTEQENIKRTLDLGAVEYLRKPLEIPALIKIVEKILN